MRSRQEEKAGAIAAREAWEKEQRERERRRRLSKLIIGGVLAVVAVGALVVAVAVTGGGGSGTPKLAEDAPFTEPTYTKAPDFEYTSNARFSSGPFKDQRDYALNIAPEHGRMAADLRAIVAPRCTNGRALGSADVYQAFVHGSSFSLRGQPRQTTVTVGHRRRKAAETISFNGQITPSGVTGTFDFTLRRGKASCHSRENYSVDAKEQPESTPIQQGDPLAPASSTATGDKVRGVKCVATEELTSHLHSMLTVYVNGAQRQIPAGVGIDRPTAEKQDGVVYASASQNHCLYWLHTHAADGIIHVESPSAKQTFTLGDFFAMWRQPLDSHHVASASGAVTAFVDGRPWTRPPQEIPLRPTERIQLNVGTKVGLNPIPVPDGLRGTT